jgi:PAS domain S-box-containing protein
MSPQDAILIVDDDPDLREVLRDLLEHDGYQVQDVGSGAAAVDRARQDRYAAVLLDMQLPDGHGQTVLQRLHEMDPALPVIVVTGYVNDDNTVGSLMKGAFAYVTKPHKPDEIRATVRRAVSVRALAVQAEAAESALTESEDRYRRQNAALIALTRSEALQTADLWTALQQITQVDATTLGVERVSFWRFSEDRTAIRCVELYELSAGRHSSGHELVSAQYPSYFRALSESDVVSADDARGDPRTAEFADTYLIPLGITSMMDVPVSLNGGLVGVLCHEHVGPARKWTPDEQAFALAMASLVALTVGQWERQRAEVALRESEERFRQVAENIHEVFWVTDVPKKRVIYISPAYADIWGRSCRSLYESPRSWLDAIHPDDRRRITEAALTRQASGEYDEEYRVVRPDDSIRWIHDRAFPVYDSSGNVYRIAGIAADITERRQAQEALRSAYDKIDSILANLPGAIVIADQDGTLVYANALAGRAFGSADTGPLTGRNVLHILPLRPPEWTTLVQGLKSLSARSPVGQPDGECAVKDRVYQYRAFPMSPRGAERLQVGLVLWDVTEQKQLQDHLIQAEKLASLGTLVSGMAHEINNPVQGILGMAELIQEEQDPGQIKEFAADIVDFSRHIATVVRNFCAYARPSFREDETEVDVRERLMEAAKMVQRSPHFGQVEIVTHLDPVPPLRARRAEIDQVFVNLISNAVQAMNGRGRLTLTTRPDGPSATATITDSGCGIPKHLMTKIFDPFFTTKDPGEGTGLGLSIVYKIVSKYSGTIKVQSEEGKGTTFILQFPIEKSPTGGEPWSNRPTLH